MSKASFKFSRLLALAAVYAVASGALFPAISYGLSPSVTAHELKQSKENITVEAKFVSSGYDTMYFTFYGETTDSWNQSGYTVETTPRVQNIKPGKQYKLVVWGLYSPDVYDLSITAPLGYVVYITDPEGSDLVRRRKVADLTQGGSSDTFYIEIVPVGSVASNPGFANSGSIASDRPVWELGMGFLENGDSAGSIQMRADEITELAFNPSDLHYSSPSDEVTVVLDGSSRLRQVYAPQGLANIIYTSGTTYFIDYYSWKDVTSWNGTTYGIRVGATVVAKYTVSKYSTIGVDVKKTVGSTYWNSRLYKSGSTWTHYDWSKNNSSPSNSNTERKVVTSVSTSGNVETRTQTEYGSPLANGAWTVSAKTQYKYTTYTWGKELTEVTLDPDTSNPPSSERLTSYSYHTTGDGEKGQLKRETRPDGGYTEYEYYNDFDKQGLVHQIKEPFEDTNAGRITTYTYTDDGTGDRFLPYEVTVTVSGNEVSKIENDYSNVTRNGEPVRWTSTKSYSNSSGYLTTQTYTYREDASDPYLRGAPYAVIKPDKTQTSWAYYPIYIYTEYEGTYLWRNYKVIKAFNGSSKDDEDLTYSASNLSSVSGDDIHDIRVMAKQSTMSENWVDISGLQTNSNLHVCDTGSTFRLVGGFTYSHDLGARRTSTKRLTYKNTGGTGSLTSTQVIYDATYTDGQLTQTIDETGVVKEYEYDDVGRLNKIEEKGKSATTTPYASPAIAEREIYISYDGSHREIKRETKSLSPVETITSTFVYDKAGRLTSKTMDCCDTVAYAYEDPGLVETTNADGGKIIESYYWDGTLESRTGDATQPLYVRSQSIAHGMKVQTAMANITTFGMPMRVGGSSKPTSWGARSESRSQPTTVRSELQSRPTTRDRPTMQPESPGNGSSIAWLDRPTPKYLPHTCTPTTI